MLTRRSALAGLSAIGIAAATPKLYAQDSNDELNFDIQFPPFGALDRPATFGYTAPSKAQKEKVAKIINETPHGPTPLAIAHSFIERFADQPEVISQGGRDEAWNPLIVEFFKATSTPANNDMIAWCAAFANWCIERNNRTGTRSASSQSFLSKSAAKYFPRTNNPQVGDMVVWSCYDMSGRTLGLGHVAFVSALPTSTSVMTVNGNVSGSGRSSIIAEKAMPTGDRPITRTVNGKRVPCTMKVSAYLSIA